MIESKMLSGNPNTLLIAALKIMKITLPYAGALHNKIHFSI